MAEDFLEEIYQDAKLIDIMRQTVRYAKVHDELHLTGYYEGHYAALLGVCQKYAQVDSAGGAELVNSLQEVYDAGNDLILVGDIIEYKILPLLEKSMGRFGTIQTVNEEGDFLFQSSRSGFLTIKDLRNNTYIHSTVDPMEEAREIAEYIFDPRRKTYSIRGCGLGYLIYQLHTISNGAVFIRIFEKDARMVDYARRYGVLDWVPADCMEVVVDADPIPFLDSASDEDTGFYMLVPELASEPYDVRQILMEFYVRYSTLMKLRRDHGINYWSNRQRECKMISEMDASYIKKDVIIVAAGPSLDDNLQFLRENKGKKTIIAVGTVLKKLLSMEIVPDIVVIIDPIEHAFQQIEGVEDQNIPLLLAINAYWKFAVAYQGEKYIIPLKTVGEVDNITEEYEDAWDSCGTVTSMALEVAVRFNAENIFLVGVDLAYPGGISHATGTADRSQISEEGLIPVEGCGGTMVYSDTVLTSYRHDMESRIAQTSWISYYNLSKVGARIAGTKDWKPV